MAKTKTHYICSECGNESINWSGKCSSCGAWNTMKEFTIGPSTKRTNASSSIKGAAPKRISELSTEAEIRFSSGIEELDRVLGGGAVEGSLVLVGGAPGIGKSTLLLQMCSNVHDRVVLYVTAEESERQLKMRADRLGLDSDNVYAIAETCLETVQECIAELKPGLVILDSIQTVSTADNDSAPGSITQVRECTLKLMRIAKDQGITIFVVGHINKEGSIAGPKILEHMVDCVLYFEGERNTSFRILRAVKNRFGSTNEIGVFEMGEQGLCGISNPSELLLAGRPLDTAGSCVTCVIEGSRPILAEVQALTGKTAYNPIRKFNGFDHNRGAMLLAVLEKKCGISVSGCDAFINVIGGIYLDEPAADLSVVMAISSSYLERPVYEDIAAIGEVGLTGELRSVSMLGQRIAEISRLGFKRCIIPAHSSEEFRCPTMEIIRANDIREALSLSLKKSDG